MRRGGLATAVALAALCWVASCGHGSPAAGPASGTSAPPLATSSARSATSTPGVSRFRCDNPIGQLVAVSRPQRVVLDAVAVNTSAVLQAQDAGGNAPHRLFAKTPLMVHVGTAAEVAVAARWATRATIAWGNQAEDWTTRLQISPCPSNGPGGDWLVYPGGLSVDQPSCVPLEVRSGGSVETVRVSVGARC